MKYLKSISTIILSIIVLISVSGIGFENHQCNNCEIGGCTEHSIALETEISSCCSHTEEVKEPVSCLSLNKPEDSTCECSYEYLKINEPFNTSSYNYQNLLPEIIGIVKTIFFEDISFISLHRNEMADISPPLLNYSSLIELVCNFRC